MLTRRRIVIGGLALIVAGCCAVALARVLPGVPEGQSSLSAFVVGLIVMAASVIDVVRGRRLMVIVGPLVPLVVAALVAACGLASWLARTSAPLAWCGGILVGLGLGQVLVGALGRPGVRPSWPRLPDMPGLAAPAWATWVALAVIDVQVLAAQSGNRISVPVLVVVLVGSAVLAAGTSILSERLASH